MRRRHAEGKSFTEVQALCIVFQFSLPSPQFSLLSLEPCFRIHEIWYPAISQEVFLLTEEGSVSF